MQYQYPKYNKRSFNHNFPNLIPTYYYDNSSQVTCDSMNNVNYIAWSHPIKIEPDYCKQQQEEEEYLQKISLKSNKNLSSKQNDINQKKFNEVISKIDSNWYKYVNPKNPTEMSFIGASVSTKYIMKVIDSSI